MHIQSAPLLFFVFLLFLSPVQPQISIPQPLPNQNISSKIHLSRLARRASLRHSPSACIYTGDILDRFLDSFRRILSTPPFSKMRLRCIASPRIRFVQRYKKVTLIRSLQSAISNQHSAIPCPHSSFIPPPIRFFSIRASKLVPEGEFLPAGLHGIFFSL